MDLLFLLAQGDLSTVPPPEDSSLNSWWPLIMAIISIIVAAVSAAFTAWQKIRERKLTAGASSEQTRLNLEIEELKFQFDSRAQLHDQLTGQIQLLLAEGRELRNELHEARLALDDKNTIIAELRAERAALKSRVTVIESELKRLKSKPEE